MNNTITEQILNYRYKTNAYIALLNENNYFSPAISNSCSADILKKVIQSTNLIVEGALPYPKSLVKKYQLNEQAGVGKVVRGVEAAMKAMEAARTARELEAATKVGKLGAEAGEATKAVSTVVGKETKPLIDLPLIPDLAKAEIKTVNTAAGAIPNHESAGANVLMNYIQHKALELAQSGYRGDELSDVVRQHVQGHNLFKYADMKDPAVRAQMQRVNDASAEIIKSAEQVSEAQKLGKSFDPALLRDYTLRPKVLKRGGISAREMEAEDIYDLKGYLRQEGKRLGLDIETGKRAQEAEPNIDWSNSLGMTKRDIKDTIAAAEKQVKIQQKEGAKAVAELTPKLSEVDYHIDDLRYEMTRRKAEGALYTPEELEAQRKTLADLQAYNKGRQRFEAAAAKAEQAARDTMTPGSYAEAVVNNKDLKDPFYQQYYKNNAEAIEAELQKLKNSNPTNPPAK
jgi:hypothetical protein